jgi:hypothetical protein
LVLIAAKAVTPLETWHRDSHGPLLTLLTSSWSDVLFALGSGVIGELAVLLVRRWRRVATTIRVLILGFFALCAVYAVAAIGLFRYFSGRSPMSWSG